MNSLATKLKEARKSKGLTQEELAEQSQVNLRTIQRIENSESEPRGKTLNLICNTLQIDLEQLLSVENSEKKKNIGPKIAQGFFLLAFLVMFWNTLVTTPKNSSLDFSL